MLVKDHPNLMRVLFAAGAIGLVSVPHLVESQYVMHLLIMGCIYTILTQSLNLIAGYMGAISIGHAAFYGIGAYTSALLALRLNLPFIVTVPCAALLAGFAGLVLAIPSLRLKSSYLVITTIAFGKAIHLIMINAVPLTRGPLGLLGIPAPFMLKLGALQIDFSTKTQYYYLMMAVMLMIMFLYYRLIHSRTGRAIIGVREDEIASAVIGVDVVYYKILSFVIGTATAGLAGALYAHYVRFISPETFSIFESITLLIMMIVGGTGTFIGPILGAFGITFLLENLRFLATFRLMIYGVILFLTIFFMPKGLVGLFDLLKRRLFPSHMEEKKQPESN